MIRPTISYEKMPYNPIFAAIYPSDIIAKKSDFVISSIIPSTDSVEYYEPTVEQRGWIATWDGQKWRVEDGQIVIKEHYASVTHFSGEHREAYAFPIDPSMTKLDIEGATRIYKNADNTGWLFAHAETIHHHDRIIQLESVMYTLFEELSQEYLNNVLKAVIGHNNPRPEIGTELLYNYSSQSGSFANYDNLLEFRKECVKQCSEVEKLLHVGQHEQEDDYYLKHQLVRAINQAKKIWKADTDKSRSLATIEGKVNLIIARVETDHTIETRWDKAKRIAAEAAARETSATEGE